MVSVVGFAWAVVGVGAGAAAAWEDPESPAEQQRP